MFIMLVMVMGVMAFIAVDGKLSVVARSFELVERQIGDASYMFWYKMPWNGNNLVLYGSQMPDGSARAIPVLLYHGTPPEGNDNAPLPQNVFIDQLKALKADGWQTITLKQFEEFMKDGKPVPAKSFLLTFDDARKESFYPVDPVLKDLNYNAVMFTITGFSLPDASTSPKPSTFYLSKTELQYMVDSGRWEIESHGDQDHRLYDVPTATSTNGVLGTIKDEHFLSNKFWLPELTRVETDSEYTQRIVNDLTKSKQVLEQDFGKPVTAFAFPFNDYGQNSANFDRSRDILAEEVHKLYEFAFYQVNAERDDAFNYPNPKQFMIKRIEPVASWDGAYLVSLLDGGNVKELPYSSNGFAHAWTSNWGSVTTGDTMTLSATDKTTGAAALLNGSGQWSNYSTTVTGDWKSGSSISLISRYQGDSSAFLSCAFMNDRIVLQMHEKGTRTTLNSKPYTLPSRNNISLAMSVAGNQATCSAYGVSATGQVKDSFVHAGSVGVQIWDSAVGAASLEVKKVEINAI